MKKTITHWLGASLIGAFFVCAPAYAQQTAADDWQASADVLTLRQPGKVETQAPNNTIEVVEFFSYTCPHCAHFEPALEAWAAKLPRDVRFTPVPAAFGGYWDAYARAYYAAEQTGVLKRSHREVFKALHETRSLPMQGVSPQELATFYAAYGVEPQRYIDALRGEQVNAKVKAAREFAMRVRVTGTPTLIINGKYMVRGRDFAEQLRNADALIARERAAARRR